ncbi:MAG TPA: BTAD domain-containing putative transcriptional regulator [Acidimicrobiales bacterium]|nr:BTAD domain-containing putative transcriptional regulator [Acidimicrobiales bacterium]
MIPVEIRLLGEVSVQARPDGPPQRFLGSSQTQLAFALLTLERDHGVTRDALAEAVWPDGLPPTWASALRTVVSRVRAFVARSLGGGDVDLLVARGGTYRLRLPAGTVVDVEQAAERIAAAQALLAGGSPADALDVVGDPIERLRAPFLPDHDGDWVAAQRARLADRLVTALELAGEAARAGGDAAAALVFAAEAVDRAPLRESAHRELMAAHVAAGNRAEALRAYQRLRRMLADEVGADPDAETEAAYLRLLGPAPTVAAPAGADDRTPPFVGRGAELAAAGEVWARSAGGARLLLVTGEVGVGKSRLVAELARQAADGGGLVLVGRAGGDGRRPYEALVDALDPVVATTPADDLPALPIRAGAALGALLPSYPGDGGPADAPVVFDAVTRLVAGLAGGHRLLVVLDDVGPEDTATLALVEHLVGHLGAAGVALVVIVRSVGWCDRRHDAAVRSLSLGDRMRRLHLGGLDDRACTELARRLGAGGDAPVPPTSELVADTAGNPRLLIELVRASLGAAIGTTGEPGYEAAGDHGRPLPVPPAVDELVAAHVDALGDPARALLRAAAVAGARFDLEVVAAAAGLAAGEALEALDMVLGAGLVVEVGGSGRDRYRFAHDLVRRSLYARLSGARRRDLHGRVADAIESAGGGRASPADVTSLAHHRCAEAGSRDDMRAVRWALAAAATARSANDTAGAERWCQEALDHVAAANVALRAEVLAELGLAQLTGPLGRAAEAGSSSLVEAAVLGRRCGRPDLAARAALGLADAVRRLPALADDAAALLRHVLDDGPAGPEGTADVPEDVWAGLVVRGIELGASPSPVAAADVASAVAVLVRRLRQLAGPEHVAARRRLAEDLDVVARAVGDPAMQVAAQHHRAMAAALMGDDALTASALDALGNALRAGGDPGGAVLMRDRAVMLAVTQGRFGEAEQAVATGPEANAGPEPAAVPLAPRQLLVAEWLQGRLAGRPAAPLPVLGDPVDADPAEDALRAVEGGDRGTARLAVRHLVSGAGAPLAGDRRLHALGLLALAAVDIADAGTAADLSALLAPFVALRCGVGYRTFVGTVTFHLGRLAAVRHEWADAERHLMAALRQLTTMDARPWVALAESSLADVLDARGRSSDREWVTALRSEAGGLAADLGLRPLGSVAAPAPT